MEIEGGERYREKGREREMRVGRDTQDFFPLMYIKYHIIYIWYCI